MEPTELLWAIEECGQAEFGDVWLTHRMAKVTAGLAAQPAVSIPTALHGWGDTKAAYRFFANRKVRPEKIIRAHAKATVERMRDESIILGLQDTTAVNFTRAGPDLGGVHPRAFCALMPRRPRRRHAARPPAPEVLGAFGREGGHGQVHAGSRRYGQWSR